MDQLTDFEIDRATTMNLGEFHFNIEIHIRGDGRVGENTLEEYYSRRIRGLYVCACVVGWLNKENICCFWIKNVRLSNEIKKNHFQVDIFDI